MKAKAAQKLRNALLISGFAVMLASYLYEPLFAVGVMIAFSCVIPDYLCNKCPQCGKRLGRNAGEFCHHCGGKIE